MKQIAAIFLCSSGFGLKGLRLNFQIVQSVRGSQTEEAAAEPSGIERYEPGEGQRLPEGEMHIEETR